MKPTLLIMAAGMGSRYGSLKQLDGIGPNNETILDYSIFDALKAGFDKVVFVIRKNFSDEFYKHVISKIEKYTECHCVFQELDDIPSGFSLPPDREKPWGTAHAILMAKDVVKEPFAAINADDFYGREAYIAMANFLSKINIKSNNYAMVGYEIMKTLSESGSVSRGVCEVDNNNMLLSVLERKKISAENNTIFDVVDDKKIFLRGNETVSMNFWGFTPTFFHYIEKYFVDFLNEHINEQKSELYIPTVIFELLKKKEASVEVLNCGAKWFGVTYKEDRPNVANNVAALIKNGIYPEKLWK